MTFRNGIVSLYLLSSTLILFLNSWKVWFKFQCVGSTDISRNISRKKHSEHSSSNSYVLGRSLYQFSCILPPQAYLICINLQRPVTDTVLALTSYFPHSFSLEKPLWGENVFSVVMQC